MRSVTSIPYASLSLLTNLLRTFAAWIDFLVQIQVATHQAGLTLPELHPENSVSLPVGSECLVPDASLQIQGQNGQRFNFFVELDCSSETIRSVKATESWDRKIRLYRAFQNACDRDFRVIIVCTKSELRLQNVLARIRETLSFEKNLFCGVFLNDLLAVEDCHLERRCFLASQGFSHAVAAEGGFRGRVG